MASDFAIAKFRFLTRLLFVHGHWSYVRLATMVLFFFYKVGTQRDKREREMLWSFFFHKVCTHTHKRTRERESTVLFFFHMVCTEREREREREREERHIVLVNIVLFVFYRSEHTHTQIHTHTQRERYIYTAGNHGPVLLLHGLHTHTE